MTSFQSFRRPSLSFGSSSRISLRRQPFSVSRPRLRPPGNIHNRSRLLLTNKIRPRFAAMSFDDFAITVPHRLTTTFVRFYMMFPYEKTKGFAVRSRVGQTQKSGCATGKSALSPDSGHWWDSHRCGQQGVSACHAAERAPFSRASGTVSAFSVNHPPW